MTRLRFDTNPADPNRVRVLRWFSGELIATATRGDRESLLARCALSEDESARIIAWIDDKEVEK